MMKKHVLNFFMLHKIMEIMEMVFMQIQMNLLNS